MKKLLNQKQLNASAVVANCRMNRERNAVGSNGYETDVQINPIEFLQDRIFSNGSANWLDICCGTGLALIETAQHFHDAANLNEVDNQQPNANQVQPTIVGVDLVDFFFPKPDHLKDLRLEIATIDEWNTSQSFDLITCVHGLHYVGDKLGAIEKAIGWLQPDGVFAANLSFENLKWQNGSAMSKAIKQKLRSFHFQYNQAKHLLRRTGGGDVSFGWTYQGADDQAGPNYTGQPAVNSYYAAN